MFIITNICVNQLFIIYILPIYLLYKKTIHQFKNIDVVIIMLYVLDI